MIELFVGVDKLVKVITLVFKENERVYKALGLVAYSADPFTWQHVNGICSSFSIKTAN